MCRLSAGVELLSLSYVFSHSMCALCVCVCVCEIIGMSFSEFYKVYVDVITKCKFESSFES